MQVSGQKPVELSPVYSPKMNGNFEPNIYLKHSIVEPALQPLNANAQVKITRKGADISPDDAAQTIIDCLDINVNIEAEKETKEFFGDALIYYDENNNLGIQDLFTVQSAVRENQQNAHSSPVVPFPTANIVYTPSTDVIPNCKRFIAGQCSYDMMFTSFAFYARPETLGFYFASESTFDDFKTWFKNQLTPMVSANMFTIEVNKLIADFDTLQLSELTESLLLRDDDTDASEEYSFPRILLQMLMQYTSVVSDAEYGVLPFSLGELYCPNSVVFVNLEKHARATAKQVKNEWEIINKAISNPYTVVSNNKLSKLTATQRTLQKASSISAAQMMRKKSATERAKAMKFKTSALTAVDITRIIKRLISKLTFVNKSENAVKCTKLTFAKPNRRDPDDFNKKGKIISRKYKPDIHIYLDTSGSISEQNYQDAMKACIKLARNLNVNLYFNSFSHVLSQCTKLNTKDRGVKQIYAEFQKVPKVTGGTNFDQIWQYIEDSKKRKRELSVIVTDFEWYPPNKFIKHPKNLYYMPCSHMDWDSITQSARQFAERMIRIKPDIRKHILF